MPHSPEAVDSVTIVMSLTYLVATESYNGLHRLNYVF